MSLRNAEPLSEVSAIDRIELLVSGVVQVRVARRVLRGADTVAVSYHRYTLTEESVVEEVNPAVRRICEAFWTSGLVTRLRAEPPEAVRG